MKTILVDISPTGEIRIESIGGECDGEMELLGKALGQVTGRDQTCAKKQEAKQVKKIQQGTG